MQISIYVTIGAGTVLSTIVSGASTPTIGTSETQVSISFSGVSVTVSAGGYISMALFAPTGSENPQSYTIYWGTGQLTNFQVPITVLT